MLDAWATFLVQAEPVMHVTTCHLQAEQHIWELVQWQQAYIPCFVEQEDVHVDDGGDL